MLYMCIYMYALLTHPLNPFPFKSLRPPSHLPNDPFCLSSRASHQVSSNSGSEGTGSLGQEKKDNPQKNKAKNILARGIIIMKTC